MTAGKGGNKVTSTVNSIDIPNIQRYHFEITVSGSSCNKYPGKLSIGSKQPAVNGRY